ncbi:MAG TPA: DUF6544 family protein [Polaromonas sp.]|uniref:DUF6920 family protein n=1 Tax=Polaromonas sp. TaxID=1869339 RepID=UPI002D72C6CA|nr:DUF6544 family protein [Polaromonas sp.]HYW58309.1 DUF6544 family protein [Polaromonas sp.]
MIWMKWFGIALAAAALCAAAAAAYGSWRWAADTRVLNERLNNAHAPRETLRYAPGELTGLPAPVQRFFRVALTDGQPLVRGASVSHTGSMNMSETGEQWKPFTSTQLVITQRPGFVWNARIMMLPFMPAYVHDAYVAGEGMLRAALFGLIPVVSTTGTPEIARGELLRFFAEMAWYPTALLPSQGVRWEAVDQNAARATLTDGALTVTLLFRFNADGLIDAVYADSRDRAVDGKASPAPWQGRFWNYVERGGMRVPLDGEVAWVLPEGVKAYWRGTVTTLQHELTD